MSQGSESPLLRWSSLSRASEDLHVSLLDSRKSYSFLSLGCYLMDVQGVDRLNVSQEECEDPEPEWHEKKSVGSRRQERVREGRSGKW